MTAVATSPEDLIRPLTPAMGGPEIYVNDNRNSTAS